MIKINSELLEKVGSVENKEEQNLTLRDFMNAINQDFDISTCEGFKRFSDELSQAYKDGVISEEVYALLT